MTLNADTLSLDKRAFFAYHQDYNNNDLPVSLF